jgi:L-alanine-DL-glutamate epimerase-like enolase superfamily enzyme
MTDMDGVVRELKTLVFTVPTPAPEADGTLSWSSTTAVVVELHAAGAVGLGWTYTAPATAGVIEDQLRPVVLGSAAQAVPDLHEQMRRVCRNLGTRGLVGHAISAVDMALWDLKARLLDVPLAELLGARPGSTTPVYGSGGFTTLDDDELQEQVAHWLQAGCRAVKIKVGESWGSREERDLARAGRVRELVGDDVQVMVDANGGYGAGQARRMGAAFDDLGVTWFEEPVSSDDLQGLAVVRASVRCDVAAGEYAYDSYDIRGLCPVVDCLQLDVTRCGGYTGWLRGAALAASWNLPVSAHCAPALHAHVAPAAPNTRHIEWFADHERVESALFTGAPDVCDGAVRAGDAAGHGMSVSPDAGRYLAGP